MTEIVPTEFITCPGPNPHPTNSALREAGKVHRVDYPKGAEAFLVMDYESVSRGLDDPCLTKRLAAAPAWYRERALKNNPMVNHHMLTNDPPAHTRLRTPVARLLTNRRVEPLRPRIQEITDDLIDAFPENAEIDLLTEFAYPLPARVICEFIGIPGPDQMMFKEWCEILNQSPTVPADPARLRTVYEELREYVKALLDIRRTEVREDLISNLVSATDEGIYSEEELVCTLMFVLIAGHETTANLIGNGMYLLLSHLDQLELLRSDPGLVGTAIEEFLRFESPTDRGTLRIAGEDMRIGDVDIPKDSFVHLCLASANRDPAQFDDPDTFDIARTPNHHLSFGRGPHFCAGANLARLEGEIAFNTLLRRLPNLRLAVPVEDLTWMADSSVSRGLRSLPVKIAERLPR